MRLKIKYLVKKKEKYGIANWELGYIMKQKRP